MPIFWSLDPLLHHTLSDILCERTLGDLKVTQVALLSGLLLSVCYPIMHKMLLKIFKTYRTINPACKQIVVLHHAMEALVLSSFTPIFTSAILRAFFQVHDIDQVVSDVRMCAHLSVIIMFMYFMEIMARYESPRLIVLFHHILACGDGIMVMWFATSVMVKTGAVLVYFICFETLTFTGLFMYRVCAENKYTSKVIFLGIIVFGITRPLQVLIIGGIAYGSWNDESQENLLIIFQCVVTLVLSILQLFTLKIHYAVWKKVTLMSEKIPKKIDAVSNTKGKEFDEENQENE